MAPANQAPSHETPLWVSFAILVVTIAFGVAIIPEFRYRASLPRERVETSLADVPWRVDSPLESHAGAVLVQHGVQRFSAHSETSPDFATLAFYDLTGTRWEWREASRLEFLCSADPGKSIIIDELRFSSNRELVQFRCTTVTNAAVARVVESPVYCTAFTGCGARPPPRRLLALVARLVVLAIGLGVVGALLSRRRLALALWARLLIVVAASLAVTAAVYRCDPRSPRARLQPIVSLAHLAWYRNDALTDCGSDGVDYASFFANCDLGPSRAESPSCEVEYECIVPETRKASLAGPFFLSLDRTIDRRSMARPQQLRRLQIPTAVGLVSVSLVAFACALVWPRRRRVLLPDGLNDPYRAEQRKPATLVLSPSPPLWCVIAIAMVFVADALLLAWRLGVW